MLSRKILPSRGQGCIRRLLHLTWESLKIATDSNMPLHGSSRGPKGLINRISKKNLTFHWRAKCLQQASMTRDAQPLTSIFTRFPTYAEGIICVCVYAYIHMYIRL